MKMHHSNSNLVKGMAVGAVVGAAAYMVGNKLAHTNKKTMKKNTQKAVRAVESFVNNMSHMM